MVEFWAAEVGHLVVEEAMVEQMVEAAANEGGTEAVLVVAEVAMAVLVAVLGVKEDGRVREDRPEAGRVVRERREDKGVDWAGQVAAMVG